MSKIEWTGKTWNPTTGCDRVSPGCDHCYAMTLAARLKRMGSARYQNDGAPRTSGPGFRLTLHPETLDMPLRVRKPTTWFVNSMSDLFHPDIPDDFIAGAFGTMAACEQHTFQVLTKRPQRMSKVLSQQVTTDWWETFFMTRNGAWCDPDGWSTPWPLLNVHVGVSIESNAYVWRANHLRKTPAAVRFLSLEPLLGPLPSLDLTGIDWVIIGGESGPGARAMDLGWVRDLIRRCRDAGVAVFVKQLGACWPGRHHRDLKGGDIDTWPEDLRIREMPTGERQRRLSPPNR